ARAIALGADAVETDVCRTRDGRFLLWHDADPDEKVALLRQAGAESLKYRPDVPRLGSPWRRPVREIDLAEFAPRYGYVLSDPDAATVAERAAGRRPVQTLEDLTDWAEDEPRVRRVFLDVKLSEGDGPAARDLLRRVQELAERATLSHVVFHVLNREREILSVLAEERRRGGPRDSVRLSADFELPGVLDQAPQLGTDDVSMGCGERTWAGYRRELCRVVGERNRTGFPSYVVAWTVNDERRLRDLVRIGVDGVMTDSIAALRRLVSP
ncbi:MAG TPA: glycerophosphodiester phosphodiesterase family protein, partial [Thermoanaerobaculia bacterium]